jgi:hypothetical protein
VVKSKVGFIESMECMPVNTIPEGPDWTYEIKLYRLAPGYGHGVLLGKHAMRFVPRMSMDKAFADDISATSVHGLANLGRALDRRADGLHTPMTDR